MLEYDHGHYTPAATWLDKAIAQEKCHNLIGLSVDFSLCCIGSRLALAVALCHEICVCLLLLVWANWWSRVQCVWAFTGWCNCSLSICYKPFGLRYYVDVKSMICAWVPWPKAATSIFKHHLLENLPPAKHQSPISHRIYYLWNSNLLSHTEFTTL